MSKFRFEVVAQYAIGQYERNQVISQHTTYELACKAAKRAGDHFTAVRAANSYMASPGKAEFLKPGRYR